MSFSKYTKAAVLAGFSLISADMAHSGAGHTGGHSDTTNIGEPGRADHVDRVIAVDMGEMFFSPEAVDVRRGETVRFVVTNSGEFVHEFNIGTEAMHMQHGSEMMMMFESGVLEADRINLGLMNSTNMAHNDPNSLLLEPGQSAEIIWTFNGDAALELSCNVPGHRESGMLGPVSVSDTGS